MKSKNIAIGILAFNEEKYIESVIKSLKKLDASLFIINDFSYDDTKSIIEQFSKEKNIFIINNKKNLGAGASTKILFEEAQNKGFEFLIKVDGDNQFLVEDVKRIIDIYKKNEYEFIKSNRFWAGGIKGNIPNIRFFGNLFATFLMQLSTGTNKLLDPLNGLFGISLKINNFLEDKRYPRRYGYPYFLTVTAVINSFKTYQINNVVKYEDQKSQISSIKMLFLLIKLTVIFYIRKFNLKKLSGPYQRSAFFDFVFFILFLTFIVFLILSTYLIFYSQTSLLSTSSILIIGFLLLILTLYTFVKSYEQEVKQRNRLIDID